MKIRNLTGHQKSDHRRFLRGLKNIDQSSKDYDYEEQREQKGLKFKKRKRKKNQLDRNFKF